MRRTLLLFALAGALLAGCVTPALPAPGPAATPVPPSPSALSTAVVRHNTAAPMPATPTATVLPLATRPGGAAATRAPTAAAGAPTAAPIRASTATAPAARPAAPTPLPPPAGLITLPTPEPPVNRYNKKPGSTYVLKAQQIVGPYAVRLWHDPELNAAMGMDAATISALGQPSIVITSASAIGLLNGMDLTGEGLPEIVIERYTGGAHCCFGTVVYQVGPTLTKILDLDSGNCAGSFQDLDKNGTYEFVTCDDSFAYAYCSYVGSPKVKVVYEYQPGRGYVPDSPHWAAHYAQDIAEHTQMARTRQPGEMTEWDHTNKCAVLPLTLDYLYSGQAARAWDALKTYYTGPDLSQFQAAIEGAVKNSPMYVTP